MKHGHIHRDLFGEHTTKIVIEVTVIWSFVPWLEIKVTQRSKLLCRLRANSKQTDTGWQSKCDEWYTKCILFVTESPGGPKQLSSPHSPISSHPSGGVWKYSLTFHLTFLKRYPEWSDLYHKIEFGISSERRGPPQLWDPYTACLSVCSITHFVFVLLLYQLSHLPVQSA